MLLLTQCCQVRKKFDHHNFVPLPKKHFINNLKNDIVESRRIVLETFLEDALMKPDVCNSSELVIFLMPSDNYTDAQTLSTKTKATKLKQPQHLKQQAKLKKLQEKEKKKSVMKKRGSIFFGGSKEKKKKEKLGKSSLASRPESDTSGDRPVTPEGQRLNRSATVDVLLTPVQAEELEKQRAARMLQAAISPRFEGSAASGSDLLRSPKMPKASAAEPVPAPAKVPAKRPVLLSGAQPTAPLAVPPRQTPSALVPRSPTRSPGTPTPPARSGLASRPLPTPGGPPPQVKGPPPKPTTAPPKPTTAPPKPRGAPPKPSPRIRGRGRQGTAAAPIPAAAVVGSPPSASPPAALSSGGSLPLGSPPVGSPPVDSPPVGLPLAASSLACSPPGEVPAAAGSPPVAARVPPPMPSQPPPSTVSEAVLAALSDAVPSRPPPPVPL